jgi:hypothetical protein
MEANELRVNSIIHFVDENVDAEIGHHNLGILLAYPSSDKYEPIPLTEEWLLRFGFESITDKNTIKSLDLYMCGGLVHLYSNNEDNYSRVTAWFQEDGEVSQNYFREVEFVHTLQNLYFALTGEELQIKK